MATGTKEKIAEIISNRKSSVGAVRKENERCTSQLQNIAKLQDSLDAYINDQSNMVNNPDIVNKFRDYKVRLSALRDKTVALQDVVSQCYSRFDRGTINIGFGGRMGQGKSYLLQKLSGLSDDEVPSKGEGVAVTANSSRIFNAQEERAQITFYSVKQFLTDVLAKQCVPVFNPPNSLDAFQCMDFNQEVEPQYVGKRNKLRDWKEHLKEYESYLGTGTQTYDLSNIRKFVSYSTKDNQEQFVWRAVQDVEIYKKFPETDVENLGLIDLPGLGEDDPTMESRHSHGFKKNADVVLFVRRPKGDRGAQWQDKDSEALRVIREGFPGTSSEKFVIFVQNEFRCDEEIPGISDKAFHEVERNIPTDKILVLRTKANDTTGLTRDVLNPVLDHLAKFLPVMDKEIFDNVLMQSRELQKNIEDFSNELLESTKDLIEDASLEKIIQDQADKSRRQFTYCCENNIKGFQDLSDNFNPRRLKERKEQNLAEEELRKGFSDEERKDIEEKEKKARESALENIKDLIAVYEKQIEKDVNAIAKSLYDYIDNGMGKGSKEEWIKEYSDVITADGPYDLLRRISHPTRVKIADEFATLNKTYKFFIDELLNLVAVAFERAFPTLFQGQEKGRDKLEMLKSRLENLDEGSVKNTLDAINYLLKLEIEHRTQFYPRAYSPIRELKDITFTPKKPLFEKNQTPEETAGIYYAEFSRICNKTIGDMCKALKENIRDIYDIFMVTLERFTDSVARFENSLPEWKSMTSAFYFEIWGNVDRQSSQAMQRVRKLARELQKCN